MGINLGNAGRMNPAGILAVSTKGRAGGINIQALSSIFFVVFFIFFLVFTFTKINFGSYIIINGLLYDP